jgi:uncharacterized protein YkwD
VPGPRPTSGDWSEPQRRRVDWTHAAPPPSRSAEADQPDGLAWLQDYLGSEPPATQAWPAEPAQTQPWSTAPASGQDWSAEPATGQHNGATAAPGLPWQAEPPTNGQHSGDAPLPGLPWRAEPANGQRDGASAASQPWSAAPPPSQTWGTPISPSLPKGMESPPSTLWSTDRQPSQARGVRSTSSAAELLRAHRVDPVTDPGGPSRDGARRRGPVAIATAIPLIVSLLLIVTAGPGRILPSRGKQAAAKRPVAAPVQPGDANRLVSLINQERARNGLPGLLVLRRLNAVAAAHSAEMASQKRIHPDPNVAANARPATSVSQYVDCASNIDQVYRRMMASATFRPKVLSPDLNGIGLGTVSGNCLWVTVLFARATPPGSAAKPASPVGGGPSPQPSSSAPTATTTRPAPATPGPVRPSSTADAITRDLFSRVNAERKARGLAALSWNGDLARLATDWSGQMARTGQFVHRDLDAARGQPGIAQFSALAENIAWVRGYADDAYQLHLGWMRSDGHRHNLLQPGYDSIGIGVVCAGGKAWATQNFGRLAASGRALSDSVPPAEPIVATAKDGLTCS